MAYLSQQHELWSELRSIAEDEGVTLYDAEKLNDRFLRVIIERPRAVGDDRPTETGEHVTSGDCSRLCRRLMVFFSVNGERFGISAEPEIEVSSPGINRSLRLPEHFQAAIGQRVKVVSSSAVDERGTHSVRGCLRRVSDSQLEIEEESTGEAICVPVDSVTKAHVDFRF